MYPFKPKRVKCASNTKHIKTDKPGEVVTDKQYTQSIKYVKCIKSIIDVYSFNSGYYISYAHEQVSKDRIAIKHKLTEIMPYDLASLYRSVKDLEFNERLADYKTTEYNQDDILTMESAHEEFKQLVIDYITSYPDFIIL